MISIGAIMKFLSLLTITLLLSGCFHYEEKLSLNKDGSGELQARFIFNRTLSKLASMDEDDDFHKLRFEVKDQPGVEVIKNSVNTVRGRRTMEIHLKFDDVRKLRNTQLRGRSGNGDNIDIREFFDEIRFDGTSYQRVIELDNKANDDDIPAILRNMIDLEFYFTVSIEGHKKRSWSYDLEDLAKRRDLIMKVD